MKVLAIEDDPEHQKVLRHGLSDAGFACDVAGTGAQGRDMLAGGGYDIAVLDRMLPDMDGMDLLREVRAGGVTTPVVILSALGSTADRVAGLSAGADDYLPKPFSADELVARIRAVLRRSGLEEDETLVFKDLTLDTRKCVASRNGRTIDLTDLEYKLLEFFMRNPNRKLPPRLILEKVWNFYGSMTNVVEARVYALRKKLNGPGEENLIVNVRGLGYALE